jgi:hypothetical protein
METFHAGESLMAGVPLLNSCKYVSMVRKSTATSARDIWTPQREPQQDETALRPSADCWIMTFSMKNTGCWIMTFCKWDPEDVTAILNLHREVEAFSKTDQNQRRRKPCNQLMSTLRVYQPAGTIAGHREQTAFGLGEAAAEGKIAAVDLRMEMTSQSSILEMAHWSAVWQ